MTGKIFRSCVLVGLAAILVCSGLFLAIMANQYEQEIYRQMKQEAAYVSRGLEETGVDYFTSLKASQRLTWVDADGTVLYDSAADPASMENHLDREEIAQALRSGEGRSEHLSSTVLEKTLYYALRLDDGTVLRVACTRSTVGAMVLGVVQPLLWVVVLALVLSGVLASRLARQITKPINSLDLENPRLDETYEELFPLVSRLREQNRTITRQMDDLSRRQREFTALAENMSEGVLLLDSKGTLLSGNQSAYALLGQGERPAVLRPDNCRREIWEAAEKALAGRHAETLMTADTRILEILASPVAANGQVTGAVILMVDVTEREERESLRREFSANVSHELKTPLHAISGYAELMKSGMVPPEDMTRFSEKIYTEVQRLIRLVEDILRLSRLDEGAEEMGWAACSLYDAARQTIRELAAPAELKGISLKLEGDDAVIYGIPQLVSAILFNLTDNAVKYNRPGGSVTVRVENRETEAVLTVTDTGIGIPQEHQERVFERFYRVDKSHSKEVGGTGLGLSIVKHAVLILGAKLNLESKVGRGTTVTVRFPKE